ncbi:hypothetical protein MMC25_002279 [Agyrium rufum]|nr:hypothetical protein [Agyrium rufum]
MHGCRPFSATRLSSAVDDSSESDDEEVLLEKRAICPPSTSSRRGLKLFLFLSILANAVLVARTLKDPAHQPIVERSQFALLDRSVPKQWDGSHVESQSEWNAVWEEKTDYSPGIIALDDSYAKSMGLPRSQRFPWDKSKGIYVLNAYHNLHCVKTIRDSIDQYRTSQPQSVAYSHVQHCLLVLRSEIMCNADDTPRYSGYQPEQSSGLGQVRMCRSWDALEAWAKHPDRSGCWKHVPGESGVNGFQVVDRYRFCPEGSKYAEAAKTGLRDVDSVFKDAE